MRAGAGGGLHRQAFETACQWNRFQISNMNRTSAIFSNCDRAAAGFRRRCLIPRRLPQQRHISRSRFALFQSSKASRHLAAHGAKTCSRRAFASSLPPIPAVRAPRLVQRRARRLQTERGKPSNRAAVLQQHFLCARHKGIAARTQGEQHVTGRRVSREARTRGRRTRQRRRRRRRRQQQHFCCAFHSTWSHHKRQDIVSHEIVSLFLTDFASRC
jgi:hypothetical protein